MLSANRARHLRVMLQFWRVPTPVFDMPIREAEVATLLVAIRRGANPGSYAAAASHERFGSGHNNKTALPTASLVFFNKDKGARRALQIRGQERGVHRFVSAEIAIHRITARTKEARIAFTP